METLIEKNIKEFVEFNEYTPNKSLIIPRELLRIRKKIIK
jgi:hypothetical protein